MRLIHDSEVGVVVGYNEEVGGFYPGSRYPILVKFERGTYEYSIESLKLVKKKKKPAGK